MGSLLKTCSSIEPGSRTRKRLCGKLAYGRRKNEKVAGTRNQYHIVKQEEYPVYDGVHEAIVSEELWQLAQKKRQETGVKSEKIYNLEHENILSGILRCPV